MSDTLGNPLEPSHSELKPTELALISCWAVVVLGLGGFASGLAITKFGTLGTISLWLVGELGGFVGRRNSDSAALSP